MFKFYGQILWDVILRPIYFYTVLPKGEWSDKPLTFAGMTAWILAAVMSIVIFFTQLWPIGATLFEKVSGWQYLIIFPVALLLAFMFFLITIMIVGGVLMALLLSLFYVLGVLIHVASHALGGRGDIFTAIKASFYSSAVLILGIFPILLIFLTKKGILDFTNFKIGYNMFYCFAVLYLYGIEAIISRKEYKVSKLKAFVAAILPVLLLIIIGLMISQLILPKMQPWLT